MLQKTILYGYLFAYENVPISLWICTSHRRQNKQFDISQVTHIQYHLESFVRHTCKEKMWTGDILLARIFVSHTHLQSLIHFQSSQGFLSVAEVHLQSIRERYSVILYESLISLIE